VSARAGEAPSLAGSTAVQVSAPAKVNLRLRILAREASGYHQLETIFLRLELADVVRVRRARTRSLDVSGAATDDGLGPTERNLAWRAAVAYGEAAGGHDGWAIELEKRIPVGGGLGGGSSDAAAVLRALDAMAVRPLGESRLLAIAATLGADVPFLTSTSACATTTACAGASESSTRMRPGSSGVSALAMLTAPASSVSAAASGGSHSPRRRGRSTACEEACIRSTVWRGFLTAT